MAGSTVRGEQDPPAVPVIGMLEYCGVTVRAENKEAVERIEREHVPLPALQDNAGEVSSDHTQDVTVNIKADTNCCQNHLALAHPPTYSSAVEIRENEDEAWVVLVLGVEGAVLVPAHCRAQPTRVKAMSKRARKEQGRGEAASHKYE
ncbi:unnamed protein product [Pleuronectes platessa]|uniref:Uncharacterized protein n=1 Tax=Pleuronectes platessa TaxID=8262 RepID=A0A9N7YUG4_PLEPL|nr:unnamed protein product [Pleuronectes platessa]